MRFSTHRSPALVLALLLAFAGPASAQNVFRAIVLDGHHEEPLAGVNVFVEGTPLGASTDQDGAVTLTNVPAGEQRITFSFIGFESATLSVSFPLADPGFVYSVRLEESHEEMEEVSVTATRTSRTIADQAARVETIAGEEIEEKISMEPSNISMLLNESPGITVQQTSAVSGGASIRIQGLDGRYTQLLMDGFPLFGGFSGGLSLLQVPPLDLRQVEVIKGPSSTLYGGDAIAGLVNLVSKGPTEEPRLSLLGNATSAGGLDLGAFYQGRQGKWGATMLATGSVQAAYDPDGDAFSNLPETRRLTLKPRVVYYPSERTTVSFGVAGTFEDREGGDIDAIGGRLTEDGPFLEQNASTRLTSQARLDHVLGDASGIETGRSDRLTVKNSVSIFDRAIEIPGYRFHGQQVASYTEVSRLRSGAGRDLVLGADLRTDAFREDAPPGAELRNYTYTSVGAFAQDTRDLSERAVLESGLRVEYHGTYGLFALPKVSLLYRLAPDLSARIGGGLGYKAPTVFLEPSEERAFRGVADLPADLDAERSTGGSMDVNYRALLFGRVSLALNQAFYFTELDAPLIPAQDGAILRYENADGTIQTRALETNAKFSLGDLKLFLGYVYLDATADFGGTEQPLPLTPEHKTYTVLVYEKHGTGRIGLEAYYTGPQNLPNGSSTEGYWITGLMMERRFGFVRLFLNFENFLDTKQANYAPVVTGTRNRPEFAEIWAPMDGFIVNGGIKIER